nr:4Fe-4S dicluster domain-containing protein [Treponema sp.]
IKSEKVDCFINQMKDFNKTEEWKNDFDFVKCNLSLFEKITKKDVLALENEVCGCDTFTLSTMHGCPAWEIESIARYLLEEKKVNTFVKMNPTLSGKLQVQNILSLKNYELEVPLDVYEQNIDLDQAVTIIKNCLSCAEKCGLKFGVKMTNTLPVFIKKQELKGERMYMSGPGLFALSVNATKSLVEALHKENVEIKKLDISYSGGADKSNISKLLECGIKTVTVCSVLLKSGGYRNLSKMLEVLDRERAATSGAARNVSQIDYKRLHKLCEKSITDSSYDRKAKASPVIKSDYSPYCSKCSNCVDVCPNRANAINVMGGKKVTVHIHSLCNECGECAKLCPMGHAPYLEKYRIELPDGKEI